MFHTAAKRGVLLHPTSIFTAKPELVLPNRIVNGTRSHWEVFHNRGVTLIVCLRNPLFVQQA